MNHSPFEEWLLSGENLPEDQKQALETHLRSCQSCSKLTDNWLQVKSALKRSPQVAPSPGFTGRFQASLAARKAKRQRRITWYIFSGVMAITLIIGLVLWLPQVSSTLNPIVLLGNLLASAVQLFSDISDARALIGGLVSSLPPLVPIALWIILAFNICIWSLIWVLCVWKLPGILRSQHEVNH